MHSDGSVNEGIAIDEFNRSVSGANIAGNIDNACDAAFEKVSESANACPRQRLHPKGGHVCRKVP